jgi:hypothetical protein
MKIQLKVQQLGMIMAIIIYLKIIRMDLVIMMFFQLKLFRLAHFLLLLLKKILGSSILLMGRLVIYLWVYSRILRKVLLLANLLIKGINLLLVIIFNVFLQNLYIYIFYG